MCVFVCVCVCVSLQGPAKKQPVHGCVCQPLINRKCCTRFPWTGMSARRRHCTDWDTVSGKEITIWFYDALCHVEKHWKWVVPMPNKGKECDSLTQKTLLASDDKLTRFKLLNHKKSAWNTYDPQYQTQNKCRNQTLQSYCHHSKLLFYSSSVGSYFMTYMRTNFIQSRDWLIEIVDLWFSKVNDNHACGRQCQA